MNKIPFLAPTLRVLVPTLAAALPVAAQGQNLIQNASFESGQLAPWTIVSGNVALSPYGAADLPGQGVSSAIGGGGLVLRDAGNGVIEQLLTPTSIPAGSSLVVSGYLGGGLNDLTRIVVRVLDGSGTQIAQHSTAYVSSIERNLESVLLRRELVVPPVAGAQSFAVRVEFANQCCGAAAAAADLITAQLVTGSTLPSPVPFGSELIVNGGFESGWTAGSPIDLNGLGWQGASSQSTLVRPYSDSDPEVPSGPVSCLIDGAAPNPSCAGGASGNLLQDSGGNGAVRQRIDVRGSTARFAAGAYSLAYHAWLGGIGGNLDTARVEVRFRAASGVVLQSGQLGPVAAAERNFESALVRREGRLVVPASTGYIDFDIVFENACCGGAFGSVDNVSAVLVPTAPVAPVPLDQNLLPNDSFELGSLPGSPLTITDANGWRGIGAGRATVDQYGGFAMPSPTFAAQNNLGNLLLRDGGNGALRAIVDLRGSQPLIASNRLAMQASAWLGGVGNNLDEAYVRVLFQTSVGVATGPIVVLPAVSAAERQNVTTMIQRISSPFHVPANAARAVVEVYFTDACCGSAYGLADDVRLVAFDTATSSSALPYPGTGTDDLFLATGVDQLPASGIGHAIEYAAAGDVLRTQVGSPLGTLDGAPVLLALDAFFTGQPRAQSFPGIWVNPHSALFLYNGWFATSFAPVVLPMSQGGNVFALAIPPGLAGVSLMLQAVALQLPTTPSPNGLYFATEAHEVRIQ